MSNLTVSGVIVKIGQATNVSKKEKPFMKREMWVEIPNGNYPQTASFEATQDRCDLLDGVTEGQAVTVHFNINGREYEGRVFNSLNLWKIEAANSQPAQPTASQPAQAAPTETGEPPVDENLPF